MDSVDVRWERNGFMVTVRWPGQESRDYEVVGHLSGYRMTCLLPEVVRRNSIE